jgi:hypothetical protein
MAARRDQDAKPRATKKSASVVESGLLGPSPSLAEMQRKIRIHLAELGIQAELRAELKQRPFAMDFEQRASLLPHLTSPAETQELALWDQAVESLGRSARVLEELAESTGEAIARIAARGDRIDRIQKETRALLNALVASETDA